MDKKSSAELAQRLIKDKGTGALDIFSVLFLKGKQLLFLPVCSSALQAPSKKRSSLTGKNLRIGHLS